MSLRWRIAIGFALVALATAAIVALATPPIVGQGFAELDNEGPGAAATAGAGATLAPGDDNEDRSSQPTPASTPTSGQAQQSTILRLLVAAAAAAAGASLLGLLLAGRMVRPLTRLEEAASGVARGDLAQRSGLADRSDEFGQLGRTFDSMAGELARSEESRCRRARKS